VRSYELIDNAAGTSFVFCPQPLRKNGHFGDFLANFCFPRFYTPPIINASGASKAVSDSFRGELQSTARCAWRIHRHSSYLSLSTPRAVNAT
jgi:hypothetical protein